MDTLTVKSIINPGIDTLNPYQPGKPIEELQREYGLDDIIKLASNENPLGTSQKVIQALENSHLSLSHYPDGACFNLKSRLAHKHCIDEQKLTLGNGSDSLLAMLTQCFANSHRPIVVSEYAFASYHLIAQSFNVPIIEVPAKGWQHDVRAMADAVDKSTAIVFIANPNNPTGCYINSEELEYLLSRIPSTCLLVLDEAYLEYAQAADHPDSLALQAKYPNLVTTRTFSKAYALAGLRIGYSISSPDIADVLNRIRLPFNISIPAQIAAIAALKDEEHLKKSIRINQQGKTQLSQAFDRLGLPYIESHTNFISVDCQTEAQPIYEELLTRGIIVRPLTPYRMPQHLRISIGLAEENQRLIDELDNILRR